MFSRHGLLHSDNGPQFSSEELDQFAKSYDILLSTSSPYYPQGNGLVERMVKTIKNLFKKSDDRYLSLLIYRSTPLPWCGLSSSDGRTWIWELWWHCGMLSRRVQQLLVISSSSQQRAGNSFLCSRIDQLQVSAKVFQVVTMRSSVHRG